MDLAGNAYVTGGAFNTTFPATSDALQGTFGGYVDGFLTKFSATGSVLYSTFRGGSDLDRATGIAVRGSDAYLTGYTASTDFPRAGPQPAGSGGRYPAYVVRIAGDAPQPSAIVNSSRGLAGPIAPGEWITIVGTRLGPAAGASNTVNAGGSVDSTLVGVQVFFDMIPGTPTYVSDSLINVVVPYEIDGRASTNVSVIYQQTVSAPIPQAVGAVSPAIYTVNFSGQGQAVAINENGTINGPLGGAGQPTPPGSVISVYGTGGGQTVPPSATGSLSPPAPALPLANSVTATIGGQPATVIFAGSSPGDLTGVLRLDIRTPAGLTGDALPVVITIGRVQSPAGPTIAMH